ncbi:hypothetical protein ABL78_5188 [Leptomonas seymouri]|uniref:Uncharacterized protein n=1 Tax=Leptomonas seymouri TaxID=5684 RepID=A0A0N0P4V3_LEPSE|nr:hypothetical protein ABL78_5188 [Leptomonas seymouri]|eukprot:KPI85739.1 hypothetical protein ABL78_5188 [Leptomonas seymouri]
MVLTRTNKAAIPTLDVKQRNHMQERAQRLPSAAKGHRCGCARDVGEQHSTAQPTRHPASTPSDDLTLSADNASELPSGVQEGDSPNLSPTSGRSTATREGMKPPVVAAHDDAPAMRSPFSWCIRRIRRSRFLSLLMAEWAVKKGFPLPPPIHRLYRAVEEAPRRGRHASHAPSEASVPPSQAHTSGEGGVTPPQGDVYHFTFSPHEVAQLRARQRRYLRLQHASPYAPKRVQLEGVADVLLNACEIDGSLTSTHQEEKEGYICDSLDPTLTPSERVAELLSVFCTRGIPQDEFIDAVFEFRMGVLRRTCKTIPVGVVVPAFVPPVTGLRDTVSAGRTPRGNTVAKAKGSETFSEPKVNYPHPGTPYTFEDLTRDPVQLSAEQRQERRTILLHRRTLSEDLYGVPSPYM